MKKIVLGLAVLGVAGMVSDVEGMWDWLASQKTAAGGTVAPVAPVNKSAAVQGTGGEPTIAFTTSERSTVEKGAKEEKAPETPNAIRRQGSFSGEKTYKVRKGDTAEAFSGRQPHLSSEESDFIFNEIKGTTTGYVSVNRQKSLMDEARTRTTEIEKEKTEKTKTAEQKKDDIKNAIAAADTVEALEAAGAKAGTFALKADLDAAALKIAELEAETKKVIATLAEKEAEVEKLKIALLEGNLIFRNPDELFRALALLRIFNSTEEAIKAANILKIFQNEQQALDAIRILEIVKRYVFNYDTK